MRRGEWRVVGTVQCATGTAEADVDFKARCTRAGIDDAPVRIDALAWRKKAKASERRRLISLGFQIPCGSPLAKTIQQRQAQARNGLRMLGTVQYADSYEDIRAAGGVRDGSELTHVVAMQIPIRRQCDA